MTFSGLGLGEKCVRKASLILAVALVAVTATSCRGSAKDYTFERTSESPLTIEKHERVPVYRTECHSWTEYGTDPSCGSYQSCTTASLLDFSLMRSAHADWPAGTRDHRDGFPGDARDHRDGSSGGGSSGGSDWGYENSNDNDNDDVTTCTTHYNSCQHTETSCSEVLDHYTAATLRLHFDPVATLLPGEKEKIKLKISGTGEAKRVDMKVVDSRYIYEFPESTGWDMSGTTSVKDIHLKAVRISIVHSSNNLEILQAGYVDDQTFKVVFNDPYIKVRNIDDSVYRFKVTRWFRTFMDIEFPLSKVGGGRSNPITLTIKKGGKAWKRNLTAGKGYNLRFGVKRKAYNFRDEFSKTRKTKVRR